MAEERSRTSTDNSELERDLEEVIGEVALASPGYIESRSYQNHKSYTR